MLSTCVVDLEAFDAEQRTVGFTALDGSVLRMRHIGGPGGRPEARVDGESLVFADWPVYESPYVRQDLNSGILHLNDGVETLTIDVTGDIPVWTEGRILRPDEGSN